MKPSPALKNNLFSTSWPGLTGKCGIKSIDSSIMSLTPSAFTVTTGTTHVIPRATSIWGNGMGSSMREGELWCLRVEIFMRGTGRMVLMKGRDVIFGQIIACTMDSGKKVKSKVWEYKIIQMGTNTKAAWNKTCEMVLELCSMQMVPSL